MKSDEVEARLNELHLREPARALDDRVTTSLAHEQDQQPVVLRPRGHFVRRVAALAAGFAIVAAIAYIGLPNKLGMNVVAPVPPVNVGDAMPAFTLKDTVGQAHDLADYGGQIVVMSIGKTQCPWWPGALDGMYRLAAEYGDRGVVFLGVDSETSNSRAEVAAFAQEQGVEFPLLKDNSHWYANRVQAERTPAMYVVTRDGILAYRGAFDDREEPDAEAEINYVARALEELLDGEGVTIAQSEPQGCPIGDSTKG